MSAPTKFSIIKLDPHDTLHDMLVEMQYHLQAHYPNIIKRFENPSGEYFGVSDRETDPDTLQDYYIVGHTSLPTDVYAEIEDGTYGELQGWRIYV